MAEKLWTVNAIKNAHREVGGHWFDPDTMRFFGTRVLSEVYQGPGGIYFVTSDHDFHKVRRYSVRHFTPENGNVHTLGEVASMTKAAAVKLAKERAGAEASVNAEAFRPVTVLEQFVSDLKAHGNPNADGIVGAADALISRAKRHGKLMELLCSDEAFCSEVNEEGEHPKVVSCRGAIRQLAKEVGATGVLFSGDPRGCTVKLAFADGFTNDFAKEGYCVPTDTE